MENSHLRLGRLEYERSSVKTNTSISVHVSHYVGEKEQAHLLSYFGHDSEVAAITAAIQENHRFDIRFPDGTKQRVGFGADPSCYKGTLALKDQKKSLRHVVAVSAILRANGSAGRTFILNDDQETDCLTWSTLVSLLGIPAHPDWAGTMIGELRRDKKIVPLSGIGCSPVLIQATREEMLVRLGAACGQKRLSFPPVNGSITWPTFALQDLL